MPQTTHDRIAELHNLAEHAHFAASAAHNAGDHRTAHELSRRALEHSMDAYRRSEEFFDRPASQYGSVQYGSAQQGSMIRSAYPTHHDVAA